MSSSDRAGEDAHVENQVENQAESHVEDQEQGETLVFHHGARTPLN